jgi:hypothetical protein
MPEIEPDEDSGGDDDDYCLNYSNKVDTNVIYHCYYYPNGEYYYMIICYNIHDAHFIRRN